MCKIELKMTIFTFLTRAHRRRFLSPTFLTSSEEAKKIRGKEKKHFGTRKAPLIPTPSTRWVAWENDILFLDSNDVKAQSGIFSEYSLCVLFSLYRVGWENHSRILFRSYQMVLCSRRYKDVGKWILFLNPFAVRRGFYESDEIMNVEASSKPSALFIASKCPHYIQI